MPRLTLGHPGAVLRVFPGWFVETLVPALENLLKITKNPDFRLQNTTPERFSDFFQRPRPLRVTHKHQGTTLERSAGPFVVSHFSVFWAVRSLGLADRKGHL